MTELRQLIEKAAKDGTTSLDLSNLRLKELPDEIDQLAHLKQLDLSDNQLFWVTFLVVIH